jgi:hypothetical protein
MGACAFSVTRKKSLVATTRRLVPSVPRSFDLFATRNGTPYLHNNLGKRWLTPKLIELSADEPGMGWHGFRRFRKTWLRGKRCQEDINNYWMGHQPETMSQLYSRLDEDLATRLREAEIVGVGFDVPAPRAPRNVEKLELELELQEQ